MKVTKLIKKYGVEYSTQGMNDVEFYSKKKSDLEIALRGQPKEDSPYTVLRITLYKGYWDVDSPYHSDTVVLNNSFDTMIEGDTNAKELHLFSETEGHIIVPIENNSFKLCKWTKLINDGRTYPFRDNSVVLNTPHDITTIFVN
jgi:hypothetical protein